ncbi:MAG: MFS transporter [Burkholderiaceae bacterium]|nr:MFS transporter [Burkholderiaceae bacterium]
MLLTLAAIQFTTVLAFMVIMPLAPQFARVFDLSAQQFGWLISAYTFAAAIAGFAASVVIERFERKRVLLAMYVGFVAAAVVTSCAQNFPMLLVARALAGIFGGVLYGVIFTVLGDAIPEARRGRATGVVMTSFAIATVAGVPIALLLSNAFNWRAAFFVVAASGAINALYARKSLPNVTPVRLTREQKPEASIWIDFMRTLTFPNHLRAFTFTFLMMISGFMVIPYISLYMTANIGLPETQLPLVYLAGGVATFFTARWFGRWADRIGKRKAYRWIALVSIAPLLIITHAPVLPLFATLLIAVIFFVFVSGRMVPAMAVVTSAAMPGGRGAFMTLNGSVMQIGSGCAATLSGALIQRLPSGALQNYNWVGWIAVAATLIAVWWVGNIETLDANVTLPRVEEPIG